MQFRYATLDQAQGERRVAVRVDVQEIVKYFASQGATVVEQVHTDLVGKFARHLAGHDPAAAAAEPLWPELDGRTEITLTEAAKLKGLSLSAVKRMRGRLPSWHVDSDGRVRLSVAELRAARSGTVGERTRRRGLARTTAANRLGVLRMVLEYADARGIPLTGKPMAGVVTVSPCKPARRRAKQVPLAVIARAAAHMSIVHQLATWLERVLGVRISEGFGPCVGDFLDFGDRLGACLLLDRQGGRSFKKTVNGVVVTVTVKERLKTEESHRDILLPRQVTEMIRVVIDAFHTDPVTGEVDLDARLIPWLRKEGAGQQAQRSALTNALAAAGIDPDVFGEITPHQLRAALIEDLREQKVPDALARRYVGHIAGEDVHDRHYSLDPARTPEELQRWRPVTDALERLIDTELGGTLMVPTPKRESFGKGNPLYSRRGHIYATLAEQGDGAPLVHADVAGNLAGRLSFSTGDCQTAFDDAAVVVQGKFTSAQVYNAAMEPRGVLAAPGGDPGTAVTLWVSTQAPHVVRRSVATTLALPTASVRVITPSVGGGFGPKGRPYPEEIAVAALAIHLRRPCRWVATRREDMLSSYHGHGLRISAELAADSDGTLRGVRARILQDVGAYLLAGLIVPRYAAEHLIGPYRMPAADVEVVAAYTNKASLAPVRGGGREQGVFALERLMDRLAQRVGVDPVELRRHNTLGPNDFPYDTHFPKRYGGTIVYDSGNFTGLLQQAVEAIGYARVRDTQDQERASGTYRGVGVALFAESTAMGKEGARVEVNDDGTVTVAAGSADTGQGHATILTQICAARLRTATERIRVVTGDTDAMGVGTGTFASRFAVMAGNATALAAEQVYQRAIALASELLGVTPDALEAADGVLSVVGQANRRVTLGEVAASARDAGIPLHATHVFAPEHPTTYAGAAHAAVVRVDPDSGSITVERYVVAHDSGTVLNPALVEGQLHGGVALGLGEALGEMMEYDDRGRLLTDRLDTYFVPRARHVPRIVVVDQGCRSRNNPVGIKGVGENGTMGALPAIVAAVEDALKPFGVTFNDMPVRAEDLVARRRQLESELLS